MVRHIPIVGHGSTLQEHPHRFGHRLQLERTTEQLHHLHVPTSMCNTQWRPPIQCTSAYCCASLKQVIDVLNASFIPCCVQRRQRDSIKKTLLHLVWPRILPNRRPTERLSSCQTGISSVSSLGKSAIARIGAIQCWPVTQQTGT